MSLFLSSENARLAHNWVVENVLGTCSLPTEHLYGFNCYMKELGLIFAEDDLKSALSEVMEDAEVAPCSGCGWYVDAYEFNEHSKCISCTLEEC